MFLKKDLITKRWEWLGIILLIIGVIINNITINYKMIEIICVFLIIFLIFIITLNRKTPRFLEFSFMSALIIVLLIYLILHYRQKIENFDNEKPKEEPEKSKEEPEKPKIDLNLFNSKNFKDSSNNIKEFVKTINGGIKLNDDDLKESEPLKIDVSKYSDDNIPNPLKQAQKETHELINTVNALKDTLTTLAPVLSEGKKLMNMFENLKV